MDKIFQFVHDNNAYFLLDNRLGFYLPLLISIFLFFYSNLKKDILNKEFVFIFVSSLFFCFLTATFKTEEFTIRGMYNDGEFDSIIEHQSLYVKNCFPVLFLLWYGIIKKNYNFNPPLIFFSSFFTQLIVDLFYAYKVENTIFTRNIGGAGIFDGLIAYSLYALLVVCLLQFLIKKLINERSNLSKV